MRRVLVVVAGFLALLAAGAPAAPAGTTAYLGNLRHDGVVGDAPPPPLGVLWAVDFGAEVSYPVVAGGRAFVIFRNDATGPYGTTLAALDLTTGRTLWTRTISGTYYWAAHAYDAGRLFVVNADGVLQALAPDTGATLWAKPMRGQYSFSAPPVATGGMVWLSGAGSGGTLYGVRQSDGAVVWTQDVMNGDDSSPAVDATRVYVTYACNQTYAFDRATGAPAWHHSGPCEGGGGATSSLGGGRLYTVEEGGLVFDTGSGGVVGAIQGGFPPALADGTAYLTSGTALRAEDAVTGVGRWTFAAASRLTTQALVAGGTAYVGSQDGYVIAVDRATGRPTWCAGTAGLPVAGGGHAFYAPPGGLGGGEGFLLVPAGPALVAYGPGGTAPALCPAGAGAPPEYTAAPAAGGGSAGTGSGGAGGSGAGGSGAAGSGLGTAGTTTSGAGAQAAPVPAADGVALVAGRRAIVFGQATTLRGAAGQSVAGGGAEVRIEADAWPYEGRWVLRKRAVTAADGTFTARVRPSRNTRLRAVVAGTASAPLEITTELGSRFTRRVLAGGALRIAWTVWGPPDARPATSRAHFYVGRRTGSVVRRARSATLRRIAPGRFRATVVLSASARDRRNHVVSCYREPQPDGWGAPRPADRRCGAARLAIRG